MLTQDENFDRLLLAVRNSHAPRDSRTPGLANRICFNKICISYPVHKTHARQVLHPRRDPSGHAKQLVLPQTVLVFLSNRSASGFFFSTTLFQPANLNNINAGGFNEGCTLYTFETKLFLTHAVIVQSSCWYLVMQTWLRHLNYTGM